MNNHARCMMGFISFAGLLVLSGASAQAEPPEGRSSTITGTATITDGDTIKVDGTKVRLSGFDTPERGSMCGRTDVYEAASDALTDFIGNGAVKCKLTGDKTFDRFVGTCSVNGKDLGAFMVESGWGRDWPKFSDGKYGAAEKKARKAKRGLWGLNCSDSLWGSRSYD